MRKQLFGIPAASEKSPATQPDIAVRNLVRSTDIAIVGMAGKLPLAGNLDQFWENLKMGVDCVRAFPESRTGDIMDYLRYKKSNTSQVQFKVLAALAEIDKFDNKYFRISHKEACLMDPEHRLFLETAWHALEDAGYAGEKIRGSKTGVFLGHTKKNSGYYGIVCELEPQFAAMALPGNLSSILASRIAYLLDLKGPSLLVDTACSSSLVAVHLACQALRSGDCEMALVGAVNTFLAPFHTPGKEGLGIESATGKARTFDDDSDGTGGGEGSIALLLKTADQALRDGDNVYALIKGSAINQDGSSIGITAPNVLAQEEVLDQAWKNARINPETLSYLEAHGTGTTLGDPIEIDGMTRAFRRYTDRKQFCAVGSVKTNLGHLDAAAGIVGLVKSALALRHRQLPPHLHFEKPNGKIAFEDSPVYPNDQLRDWETPEEGPRRCGVSAFGISGTNCHVVLEESPARPVTERPRKEAYLFAASAASEQALRVLLEQYDAFLARSGPMDPADLCYTVNAGREHRPCRLAIVLRDTGELHHKIAQLLRTWPEETGREGVYYHCHTLLSTERPDPRKNEVTRQQLNQLTDRAGRVLRQMQEQGTQDTLHALAALYVQGAAIDWEGLHAGERNRKLSLPLYPFERKRCWVEYPPTQSPAQPPGPPQTEVPMNNQSVSAGPAAGQVREAEILHRLKAFAGGAMERNAEDVDVHETFFEMGIDSVSIIQVKQLVKNEFDVAVPVDQLFNEIATLHKLAGFIAGQAPAAALPAASAAQAAPPRPGNDAPPPEGAATATREVPPMRELPGVAAGDVLENIIQQQLALMARQLELLGQAPAGDRPAKAAPGPGAPPPARPVTPPPAVRPADGSTEIKPLLPHQAVDINNNIVTSHEQEQYVAGFIARYTQRTRNSKAATQRHREHFANNRHVYGYTKKLKELIYPVVAESARGARVRDLDGNEYVDYAMGFGAFLLGYHHPEVQRAIEQQLAAGVFLGPMSVLPGEVAELISELTGVDRVAFYNSGTEAVMVALRLARAATGRTKIVIFKGAYHGTYDGVLAQQDQFSGRLTGIPMATGISQKMVDDVLVLEYGNPESLKIIEAHASELAAVLVEPVQSRRPDLQPKAFLEALRRMTTEGNVALIFDEIITGFRIHPGGAQAWFGIRADLVTYGKIAGGGLPIGIVGGKAEWMLGIDGGTWQYGDDSHPVFDHRKTFVAGTFCHHPLAMAAAKATLTLLRREGPALQEKLNARTGQLVATLRAYFEQEGLAIQVVHFGSLFQFRSGYDLSLFLYHLIENGIYAWEGRTFFLSTAHTDEDIAAFVNAVQKITRQLRLVRFLPAPDPASTAPAPQADAPVRQVPLTEEQKRLHFLTLRHAGPAAAFHEAFILTFPENVNQAAVAWAVQQLVDRHEALRTGCIDEHCQHILPGLAPQVPLVPLAGGATGEAARQWYGQELEKPFDFSRGPLFRAFAVDLGTGSSALVFIIHKIIADGWALSVLHRELSQLYAAMAGDVPLRLPPARQFGEYVAWLHEKYQSEEGVRARQYWEKAFSAPGSPAALPTGPFRRNFGPVSHPVSYCLDAGADVTGALKRLSREQGTTLFMTLLAVFQTLLYRLTQRRDVLVGLPSSGQLQMGADALVGQCVQMIPFAARLDATGSFAGLLKATKARFVEVFAHQPFSYAQVMENAALHLPDVRVVFNLDAPVKKDAAVGTPGGSGYAVTKVAAAGSSYDFFLNAIEVNEGLRFTFQYNSDLYEEAIVGAWVSEFRALLEAVIAQPGAPLCRLGKAPQPGAASLPPAGGEPAAAGSVSDWFEVEVHRQPPPVLQWNANEIALETLRTRANALTHQLTMLGLKPGERAGILLKAPRQVLLAVLAVRKAGGAYVILDPAADERQIQQQCQALSVTVLMTDGPGNFYNVRLLHVPPGADPSTTGTVPRNVSCAPDAAARVCVPAENGLPAGVAFTHRTLLGYYRRLQAAFGFGPARPVTIYSAGFDQATLVDLVLAAVTASAQVRVSTGDFESDWQRGAAGTAGETTLMHQTPWFALLRQARRASVAPAGATDSSRLVVIGEMPLLTGHAGEWYQSVYGEVSLQYAYKPADWPLLVAHCAVPAGTTAPGQITLCPVGRPLADHDAWVADPLLEPAVTGSYGALCVRLDEANASLPAGAAPDAAYFTRATGGGAPSGWYRTRSVCRVLPGGELELIRFPGTGAPSGGLVEPGLAGLLAGLHPDVRDAAAVVLADGPGKEGSREGYVVAAVFRQPGEDGAGTLMAYLARYLAPGALPVRIVSLPELPRLSTGEPDQRYLQQCTGEVPVAPDEPGDETVRRLAEMFRFILGTETVRANDSFFVCGGNSLKAMQLLSRIRQEFNVAISWHTLFAQPTVAGLAQALRNTRQQSAGGVAPVEPRDGYEVSHGQRRLWVLNRLEQQSTAYHLSNTFVIEQALNAEAFEKAFAALIERHESLRTTFAEVDGVLKQYVKALRDAGFQLQWVDLEGAAAGDDQVRTLARQEIVAPFDLQNGPLLRARMIRLAPEKHLLVFTMHHIICDDWSMDVLAEEFMTLYREACAGRNSPLPPLTIHYKDFAYWQQNQLAGNHSGSHKQYWQDQFKGGPPVLQLNTDYPRPESKTFAGNAVGLELDEAVSGQLQDFCRRQEVTLYMTLLAALKTVLYTATGQTDLVVGSPFSGRNHKDLENQIGFYINTLALRTRFTPEDRFSQLLGEVRAVVLGAFEHQIYPFDLLVTDLQSLRDPGRNPLFDVGFTFHTFNYDPFARSGEHLMQFRPVNLHLDLKTVKTDLWLHGTQAAGKIMLDFLYATDLFRGESVQRLAADFHLVINAILTDPDASLARLMHLVHEDRLASARTARQHKRKNKSDQLADYLRRLEQAGSAPPL